MAVHTTYWFHSIYGKGEPFPLVWSCSKWNKRICVGLSLDSALLHLSIYQSLHIQHSGNFWDVLGRLGSKDPTPNAPGPSPKPAWLPPGPSQWQSMSTLCRSRGQLSVGLWSEWGCADLMVWDGAKVAGVEGAGIIPRHPISRHRAPSSLWPLKLNLLCCVKVYFSK